MPSRSSRRPPSRALRIRLDDHSRDCLTQAARLRGISPSDYVRTVAVPQRAARCAPLESRRWH